VSCAQAKHAKSCRTAHSGQMPLTSQRKVCIACQWCLTVTSMLTSAHSDWPRSLPAMHVMVHRPTAHCTHPASRHSKLRAHYCSITRSNGQHHHVSSSLPQQQQQHSSVQQQQEALPTTPSAAGASHTTHTSSRSSTIIISSSRRHALLRLAAAPLACGAASLLLLQPNSVAAAAVAMGEVDDAALQAAVAKIAGGEGDGVFRALQQTPGGLRWFDLSEGSGRSPVDGTFIK
jgi:hypothetical protein